MRYRNFSGRGFTLIELMITVAILALLASLAVPSYRAFLINQRLSAASSDFLVSILHARSEAIRKGKIVAVFPTDGANWTSGWYSSVVDTNCTLVGDRFSVNDGLAGFISINSSTTNNPFSGTAPFFAYSSVGFPYQCPSYAGSMNGSLAFQAIDTGRERRVVVSLAGRGKICDPSKVSSCD